MKKPSVSVIMATYNGQDRISLSIRSILSQTYDDFEFIICDDCSTDNTYKILQELAQTDSRIKIIRNEKNSKLAYSLNKCLELCQGEFIARMDDDDESLPHRLETQVNFLTQHPEYSVVGSNAILKEDNKEPTLLKVKEFPKTNDVLLGTPFIHPTIMMRKQTYDLLNGYTVSSTTKRSQDWDLWFRFFAKKQKGYNIQEPLYLYTRNGLQSKKTIQSALTCTKIMLHGYHQLKVPFYKYAFLAKPLISVLLPNFILKHVRLAK